jgi:hypothetical protein
MSDKRPIPKGQSMVEYAGMMVIATLMVGGLLAGAQQCMPTLFAALTQSNQIAFTESEPASPSAPVSK